MWRLIFAAALAVGLMTTATGCKAKRRVRVETVEDEGGPMASVILMSDPKPVIQLVDGFHQLEQNAWRWVKGKFAVTLKPPMGSAQSGARLELKFNLPGAVLSKTGPTTLSAKIGSLALEPQTFSAEGEYTYARDVPASALGGEAATVDFAFDKFLAAGQVESRELSAIVTSVGLTVKK